MKVLWLGHFVTKVTTCPILVFADVVVPGSEEDSGSNFKTDVLISETKHIKTPEMIRSFKKAPPSKRKRYACVLTSTQKREKNQQEAAVKNKKIKLTRARKNTKQN